MKCSKLSKHGRISLAVHTKYKHTIVYLRAMYAVTVVTSAFIGLELLGGTVVSG